MNQQKQNKSPPPRLLWIHAGCLLDSTSGAAMAVREMLLQLQRRGWLVEVIGATLFDAQQGVNGLGPQRHRLSDNKTGVVRIDDGVLRHQLVVTQSIDRHQMTAIEESTWFNLYCHYLENFSPDVVFFFGGFAADLLIPSEARHYGIPTATYLANGSYRGHRWHRDVQCVFTNSHATAELYRQRLGLDAIPVGAFVRPDKVKASKRHPERVLMVNPTLEKGGGILVRIALMLEKRRPDITFEVVEGRGDWRQLVRDVTRSFGQPRDELGNVVVTPNTTDMRPVYARCRLLLVLSLWWEAFGRVAVEAQLNGIPVIATNRGGLVEAVGDGGLLVDFPQELFQPPFNEVPNEAALLPLVQSIERFYDDEAFYQAYVEKAQHQAKLHSIEQNSVRLDGALRALLRRADRAGPVGKTP